MRACVRGVCIYCTGVELPVLQRQPPTLPCGDARVGRPRADAVLLRMGRGEEGTGTSQLRLPDAHPRAFTASRVSSCGNRGCLTQGRVPGRSVHEGGLPSPDFVDAQLGCEREKQIWDRAVIAQGRECTVGQDSLLRDGEGQACGTFS